MEFAWTREEDRYRADLRSFLREEVPAEWWEFPKQRHPHGEQDRARTIAFNRKLGERGWLTPHWPVEYGGGGATPWQHMILGEEMWSIGEPRGPQYMNVNWIGPAIMAYATEEQKAYHLRRISAGEVFWCQGFSEPDAGSDLASLRTRAQRDGDDYVVNGQKIWTSHCQVADWCFLLARTDTDAERHRGISVLLVPMDTPGIEVRPIESMAGTFAEFHEVFFTDVRVPVANRLGAENEGWTIVREVLKYERVGSPRWERASLILECLARWAEDNGRFEEPGVRERFAQAKAVCEAARLLAYAVVDERVKETPQTAIAYLARVAIVRAERAVAEVGMETMGDEALAGETLPADAFFEAQIAGVAAGAYEIQLGLVARELLGLGGR